MDVKQVFLSYGMELHDGLAKLKFCPLCGGRCVSKEDGGKWRPTCSACGFVHYRNPFPASVVLIEAQGRVLLGRRGPESFKPGKWCMPGGFIEYDEDFLSAAIREVKEETGLDVEIESILNVVSGFSSSDLHALVIILLGRVLGGHLCPGDDIEALAWFPLSGPLPDMAFSPERYMLEKFSRAKAKGLPVDQAFSRKPDDGRPGVTGPV